MHYEQARSTGRSTEHGRQTSASTTQASRSPCLAHLGLAKLVYVLSDLPLRFHSPLALPTFDIIVKKRVLVFLTRKLTREGPSCPASLSFCSPPLPLLQRFSQSIDIRSTYLAPGHVSTTFSHEVHALSVLHSIPTYLAVIFIPYFLLGTELSSFVIHHLPPIHSSIPPSITHHPSHITHHTSHIMPGPRQLRIHLHPHNPLRPRNQNQNQHRNHDPRSPAARPLQP